MMSSGVVILLITGILWCYCHQSCLDLCHCGVSSSYQSADIPSSAVSINLVIMIKIASSAYHPLVSWVTIITMSSFSSLMVLHTMLLVSSWW